MLLDSQRGRDELRHNDRMMGRLPGMSGCSLTPVRFVVACTEVRTSSNGEL
jgi:hypothetical protein